jgi:hypothetical protein
MIDHKATLPVEAGVVIRLTMELEERRQADDGLRGVSSKPQTS